jgi:hypothetical protein
MQGMGLDWDDLQTLRVFQQSVQRRSDGRVRIDDFVYVMRAHGAMHVRTCSLCLSSHSSHCLTPISSITLLQVKLNWDMLHPSGSTAARPSTSASRSSTQSTHSGGGGGSSELDARTIAKLQSGLADMRERLLELDTRWAHKVQSIKSEHHKMMEKVRFLFVLKWKKTSTQNVRTKRFICLCSVQMKSTHEEQVRVMSQDATQRIKQLEVCTALRCTFYHLCFCFTCFGARSLIRCIAFCGALCCLLV